MAGNELPYDRLLAELVGDGAGEVCKVEGVELVRAVRIVSCHGPLDRARFASRAARPAAQNRAVGTRNRSSCLFRTSEAALAPA